MNSEKILKRYSQNQYFNQKENFKAIMSELNKEKEFTNRPILGLVASICIIVIGTTGLVFASTKIYNNYKNNSIKEQKILTVNKDEISAVGYNFLEKNDHLFEEKNMKQDKETSYYYDVITDFDKYNFYKNEEDRIPNMTESDFEKNDLILAIAPGERKPIDQGLSIAEVYSDNDTTYVIFEQADGFEINSEDSLFRCMYYAIVDKDVIKENIKFKIDVEIGNEEFTKLEELPENYSVEEALKDGCFVIENEKVISEDKERLDEFLNSAKNGKEGFIRIYEKMSDGEVVISDLNYNKNNYFILRKLFVASPWHNITLSCEKDLYKNYVLYKGNYVYRYELTLIRDGIAYPGREIATILAD